MDRDASYAVEPASPYQIKTFPNLRTLKITCRSNLEEDIGSFLDSLRLPAIEVVKIRCMGPVISRLVSMVSRSYEPSRLQKLSFCTIPLQAGELSALLKLTPQLVKLDIDVPPMYDIFKLTHCEGDVVLVPMLQALYMHSPVLARGAQTKHFDDLAQVRCELGSHKMPSLRTWTHLHTLRFVFDSGESRDRSQKTLNDGSSESSFTSGPEEVMAIKLLGFCRELVYNNGSWFESNLVGLQSCMRLDQLLACIECSKVTTKMLRVCSNILSGVFSTYGFFLQETNIHISFRHALGRLMNLPDHDKYRLKQRVTDLLAEWDQLLLNNLDEYRWARTSPKLCDYSLIYLPKNKFHGK